jgi:hypothetical protein
MPLTITSGGMGALPRPISTMPMSMPSIDDTIGMNGTVTLPNTSWRPTSISSV